MPTLIAAVLAAGALSSCGSGNNATACSGGGKRVALYAASDARTGRPAGATKVDDAVRLLCDRARARKLPVDIRRAGAGIEVRADKPPPPAALAALTARRELAFYDWEPNVYVDATTTLAQLQLEDPVRGLAQESPAALPLTAAERLGKRLGKGVVVVSDHGRYYVVRDRPALTGADIVNPRQDFDPQIREPIVTFQFTAKGQAAFERATAEEARRGVYLTAPPTLPREQRFQHFAIVIDDRIVSLAFVDADAHPKGIDARNGTQIEGAGSMSATRQLADDLRAGALPVELERAGP